MWVLAVFIKTRYLSSWVFAAMHSIHIRINLSLSLPLKNPESAHICTTHKQDRLSSLSFYWERHFNTAKASVLRWNYRKMYYF